MLGETCPAINEMAGGTYPRVRVPRQGVLSKDQKRMPQVRDPVPLVSKQLQLLVKQVPVVGEEVPLV
jgi:hypothetical protein